MTPPNWPTTPRSRRPTSASDPGLTAATDRPQVGRLLWLSAGHLITDVNQGAVILLVPVVQATMHLDIGTAALVVTVSTLASSIVQPVFGVFSDRHDLRWMIPAGVLVAGLGLAFASLAPVFPLVLVGVLLSGLGVAAFHPEATRWAGASAGSRRATGMSWFSVGGNAGYALGVLATAPLVALGGRALMTVLVAPPLLIAVKLRTLVTEFKRASGFERQSVSSAIRAGLSRDVLLLVGFIAVRSVAQVGMATFAPLYLHLVRGMSLTSAGSITFAFLIAGAFGTLLGGPLADRFGRKRQLLGSFALMPLLGIAFLYLPGPGGYLGLLLMGLLSVSTFAVTVTMAQELMPRHTGTASGITIGFAIGVGGLAVAVLGQLADHYGLATTILVVSLAPIAGILVILPLREPARTPRGLRAADALTHGE